MASLALPHIATTIPNALFDELVSSIRGPVFRPGDAEYVQLYPPPDDPGTDLNALQIFRAV